MQLSFNIDQNNGYVFIHLIDFSSILSKSFTVQVLGIVSYTYNLEAKDGWI